MAILCANCGQALPKDDARFCSHCGTVVSPQPLKSQTSTESKNLSVSTQGARSKPVLREQIAQQPPARPKTVGFRQQPSVQTGSKPGDEKYQKPVTGNVTIDQAEKPSSTPGAWPTSMTYVSVAKTSLHENGDVVPGVQEDFSSPFPHDFPAHARQGRVKERQDAPSLILPETLPVTDGDLAKDLRITSQGAPIAEDLSVEAETIEKHPMLLLETSAAEQTISPYDEDIVQSGDISDAVEDIATRPLTHEVKEPHLSGSWPSFGTPLRASSARKIPVVIVTVLLALLLVGGVGAWMWLVQPFSVPAITQPEQHFQDVGLGISLQYPTGWQTQLERGKSTVHFFDSSHTAQVNVVMANKADGDLTKYLQQQSSQLGLTNGQASTTVFAGTSWQAIQGSVVQDGANYTAAIFAAVHGARIVTITQLAPQNVYSDEEQLIFSTMRRSLQLS